MAERWEQRFENFEKQLNNLIKSFEQESFSDLEMFGVVRYFELTLSLAFITLHHLLGSSSDFYAPRQIIIESIRQEIIQNQSLWLEMMKTRNNNEELIENEYLENVVRKIKYDYIPTLKELQLRLLIEKKQLVK